MTAQEIFSKIDASILAVIGEISFYKQNGETGSGFKKDKWDGYSFIYNGEKFVFRCFESWGKGNARVDIVDSKGVISVLREGMLHDFLTAIASRKRKNVIEAMTTMKHNFIACMLWVEYMSQHQLTTALELAKRNYSQDKIVDTEYEEFLWGELKNPEYWITRIGK